MFLNTFSLHDSRNSLKVRIFCVSYANCWYGDLLKPRHKSTYWVCIMWKELKPGTPELIDLNSPSKCMSLIDLKG